VQPLRRTGLPADLPDRRDLEARRTASSTSTRRCASAAAAARRPAPSARRSTIPEQNIVKKCNMCVDEIEAGRKPYCVMACMMRVLDIGPIDQLRAGTTKTKAIGPDKPVRQVKNFADPELTHPSIAFVPTSRCARSRTWPIRS
jgi:Fe-S-cluster-containing dehydrogenase component